MAHRKTRQTGHTGQTRSGNTRDVKIERIGRVSIHQRGSTYCLVSTTETEGEANAGGLVTGAEGHGIAAWLNRHGISYG